MDQIKILLKYHHGFGKISTIVLFLFSQPTFCLLLKYNLQPSFLEMGKFDILKTSSKFIFRDPTLDNRARKKMSTKFFRMTKQMKKRNSKKISKKSFACLRQCLVRGHLHPAQCHSLCFY